MGNSSKKVCITCEENLDISCYHNNKRRLSGKNNECKNCCSIRVKVCLQNSINRRLVTSEGDKKCTICGCLKNINDFYIRNDGSDGRQQSCKTCIKKRVKEWRVSTNYYKKNKSKFIESREKWVKKNPGALKKSSKRYYDNNKQKCSDKYKKYYANNKEKRINYSKAHKAKNIEKYRESSRKWRKENGSTPFRRLRKNVSNRVLKALKNRKMSKSCMELIGCNLKELIAHIESQFVEGMGWHNMGRGGWHVDHKRPISWFNILDKNELLMAMNYKNLQPLWESENCKKGNRYEHV